MSKNQLDPLKRVSINTQTSLAHTHTHTHTHTHAYNPSGQPNRDHARQKAIPLIVILVLASLLASDRMPRCDRDDFSAIT